MRGITLNNRGRSVAFGIRSSIVGIAWFLTLGIAADVRVSAQGLIIDRRPIIPIARAFEVREVSINARVRDQVAEVQVSQTFHNPGSTQLEAEFLFPLPDDGAIQNFVLLVDGREFPGRLMSKDEARKIYEEIVRTKRDPALLEYMGRGLFRTSIFPIPPGADRKLTMRYTQLCKRDRDIVEFGYPLGTQKFTTKPIQNLKLDISIESKDSIKSVYSPSDDASIRRDGDHHARLILERRDVIPTADFRLVYTLAEGAIGASVLSFRPSESDDGYFLLLASPEVKVENVPAPPKTVIFVLDRSGSMAGKKIEQARNALKSVLNNLREGDLFNILVYDDRVEAFKPELQRFSTSIREEALRYVDNIREGGSTNIDVALKASLAMIADSSRPSYLIFLTDGLPTAGENRELNIAENCRQANSHQTRIFCFGVGYDVNARLLDRVSGGNRGTSEYVKPDENIEVHLGRFAAKLTSPVLSDIKIELVGSDVNRTYPRDIPDLFEGGQLVWVGRYPKGGPTNVRISGKVGSERRVHEYPVRLAGSGEYTGHDYVERLWAMRRIGALIDQIDLSGQNKELIDELVALSTKFGILTPYTSFLADERVQLHARESNFGIARDSLRQLNEVSGASGVSQRGLKQAYIQADRAATPGMMGGGMAGSARYAAPAAPNLKPSEGRTTAGLSIDAKSRSEQAGQSTATVRQVGRKTFYFKDGRWLDSEVKPEEAARARTIKQFSDDFFSLAKNQEAEVNQYLTFTEPITVKLGDSVYKIDPETSVKP